MAEFSNLSKLAADGWLFTSHKLDLSGAEGHGKNVQGLTLEQAIKRYEGDYEVIGLKGGVQLADGHYSLVLDCDAKGYFEKIQERLPILKITLQHKGSKLGHFVVKTDQPVEKQAINLSDKTRVIDILGIGGMAVAPPSRHRKTGKPYEIINDAEPAFVSWQDIKATLLDLCREEQLTWPNVYPEIKPNFSDTPRDEIAEAIKAKITLFDFGLKAGLQRCPLSGHKNGDTNPSLSVSADGRLFNCFSRHGGGDIFTWLTIHDNCDFITSKRLLCQKYVALSALNPNSAEINDVERNIALFALSQGSAENNKSALCTTTLKGSATVQNLVSAQKMNTQKSYTGLLFGDIKEEQLQPPSFLIKDYVPEFHLTLISAAPKCFKSTIAEYFAAHIAAGRPLWDGEPIKRRKVAYIDEEDCLPHLYQNFEAIIAGFSEEEKTAVRENLRLFSSQGFNFSDLNAMQKMFQDYKPEVVLVDTLRRALDGDENESGDIANLYAEALAPAMRDYNITWILLHHNRKVGQNDKKFGVDASLIRGSSDLFAISGSAIMLERLKNENEVVLHHIGSKWTGEKKPHSLKVQRENGVLSILDLGEKEENYAAFVKRARDIEDWLIATKRTDDIKTSEITAEFGKNDTTGKAIGQLKAEGKLVGKGKDNKSPFTFVVSSTKLKTGQTKICGDDE